jgi:hypothetical protein
MQKKLQKQLGAAAQKEDQSKPSLLRVAEDMLQARQQLDKRDSGVVTQHLQGQIVSDLIVLRQHFERPQAHERWQREAGTRPRTNSRKPFIESPGK